MNKWIVCSLTLLWILPTVLSVEASGRKKKKGKEEMKVELSKYDKLFKGKRSETARGGFVTVHKVDGKVYLEYPLKYMGRELLLAAVSTASTDNTVCTNGYKENTPMHIRFTLEDSTVQMRKVNAVIAAKSAGERMDRIMEQNFGDPIMAKYKVLAYSPDSTAVVFDMTGIFLDEEAALSPVPKGSGLMEVTKSLNKDLSSIREVKAFEDNMSVKSQLVYKYSVTYNKARVVTDQPLTVLATRSLLLLPERKMPPRLSDRRIGVFLTSKQYVSDQGEPTERYTYANRWWLEPSDVEAYRRGELTEPVKPIVFYVDTLFPEAWKQPIREGILKWNRAFEKIGFKNVMQVREFPKDDPAFDPDNLKYSCVRYVPTGVANAMGPSWVDPTTGEILNACVLVYNNVIQMLRNWRFVQTAQVDPAVRNKELPAALVNESLAYVIAHEIGHCLGLMHNMSASAAYPVDSLRSESFTRKYGTTPSIMDYARFNYVAQPEDRGVKLMPPDLGVYDEFVIKWLYSPVYEAATIWDEAKVLETWVDEQMKDPMYRYGRQQIGGRYDPTALEEDLGDDAMKAGEYGIKNLKYILPHLNEWIADDPEATARRALYVQMVNQYYRYIRNVIYNIGGVYLSDAKEDISIERFRPVERERQKASVAWVMAQLRDCEWWDNPALLKKFPLGIMSSPTIVEAVGKQLMAAAPRVALSSSLSDEPYSMEEYFDDLYRGIWSSVLENRKLTTGDMVLQRLLLNQLNDLIRAVGGNRLGIASGNPGEVLNELYAPSAFDAECYGLDAFLLTRDFGSGYGWQRPLDVAKIDESATYYYQMVLRIRDLLESKMKSFDAEDLPHYEAMLFAMKQMLGKQAQIK
ncbi:MULTISPECIES: zinc-dependent metalloprotease [Butyricimonas]|uniref:zinc-dependent metalloprotease n=1 Tax=Butyricimonas TaxID=574697 RepID=UPI0007FB2E2B|nr:MULTISPECIES: zinc-dependent metalloprotease [Butyricimonas]